MLDTVAKIQMILLYMKYAWKIKDLKQYDIFQMLKIYATVLQQNVHSEEFPAIQCN